MIGASVVTLPMVMPISMLPATSISGTDHRAIAASAPAATIIITAAVVRALIWSAKRASTRRLKRAAIAVTDTAIEVPAAPSAGDSNVT